MIYLGENIAFLLRKFNLKQDELGNMFGLSKGVVGTYVRNVATPKYDILIKIAEYFTITIDDLLTKDIEKTGYTKTYKVYVNKNKKVVESKNIVNEVSSLGYPTNEKETITMEHIVGEIVSKQLQTLTCEIDIIKEILKINNILDTLK